MTQRTSFVLPIDKPAGPTSHDVVARARHALKERRIGHTGTLDPFASGLLLLCVGQTTRIAEFLNDLPKTYRATARFDGSTATDDNTSAVTVGSERWRELTNAAVERAFQQQVGDVLQLPPQYSAKKLAGERAYDIARRGGVATLTPVAVHIAAIDIHRIELPDVEFDVTCSSGTYIRAIARDAGEALGTGGYLTALRRTRVGEHAVEQALPLAHIDDAAAVQAAALDPLSALSHMVAIEINEAEARAIRFGQAISKEVAADQQVLLVHEGALIAIARSEAGQLRPRKVLTDA